MKNSVNQIIIYFHFQRRIEVRQQNTTYIKSSNLGTAAYLNITSPLSTSHRQNPCDSASRKRRNTMRMLTVKYFAVIRELLLRFYWLKVISRNTKRPTKWRSAMSDGCCNTDAGVGGIFAKKRDEAAMAHGE